MGRRLVIGYARSKAEGLIYEQLLRDRDVPAFSEMGIAAGEFTESAQSRIFADVELLFLEHLDEIREVLGSSSADADLNDLEAELKAGAPPYPFGIEPHELIEPHEQIIARFEDASEARMCYGLLRKRRLPVEEFQLDDSHVLITRTGLTEEELSIAKDYLGDRLLV